MVICKVNGEEITTQNVDIRFTSYLNDAIESGITDDWDKNNLEINYRNLRLEILDKLIDESLLIQYGKNHNYKPSPEEIDIQLKQIILGFPSIAEYKKALIETGVSHEQVIEDIEKQLIIQRIKENINIADINEDALYEYFKLNQGNFNKIHSIRLYHIFIASKEDAKNEEKIEAIEKITKIKELLKEGQDFSEVASKYSECPSKERGGDLGFVTRELLDDEDFADACFSLEVDHISEIIESNYGYHIAVVREKQENTPVTFEEAKKSLKDFLINSAKDQTIEEIIEDLREKSEIEYFLK